MTHTDQGTDATLDEYIKSLQNQEIKGILLKLKNEMRKPGTTWEDIRPVLAALLAKDSRVFMETAPLFLAA